MHFSRKSHYTMFVWVGPEHNRIGPTVTELAYVSGSATTDCRVHVSSSSAVT